MEIEIKEQAPFSIVSLSGDVDMHSSPKVRQHVLDCLKKNGSVLVELSAVTYMDSSGVASLVEGFQLAKKQSLKFGLVAVSKPVMNVLKLARLDGVFPIYSSVEQCLASV